MHRIITRLLILICLAAPLWLSLLNSRLTQDHSLNLPARLTYQIAGSFNHIVQHPSTPVWLRPWVINGLDWFIELQPAERRRVIEYYLSLTYDNG